MNKIDWTKLAAIAEILSAVAIVITLVYLGLQTRFLAEQTRQNSEYLQLSVIQGYSDNLSELDEFIAGNRDFSLLLEEMAEEGLEIDDLDRNEQIRMRAWDRWQLREWESSFNLFVISDPGVNPLRRHILGQMQIAPRVYDIWRGRQGTFTAAFNNFIQEIAVEAGIE